MQAFDKKTQTAGNDLWISSLSKLTTRCYAIICYHRFTFLSNLPTFLSFDMHWHSEPPPPHQPLSSFGAGTRKLVASICHGNPATKPSISWCCSYLKVQMLQNYLDIQASSILIIKHFNYTQTVLFVPKVAGTRTTHLRKEARLCTVSVFKSVIDVLCPLPLAALALSPQPKLDRKVMTSDPNQLSNLRARVPQPPGAMQGV